MVFSYMPSNIIDAACRGSAAVDRSVTEPTASNSKIIAWLRTRERSKIRQQQSHLLARSAAGPNLGGLGSATLASLDVCHDSHSPIERASATTRVDGRQRSIWRAETVSLGLSETYTEKRGSRGVGWAIRLIRKVHTREDVCWAMPEGGGGEGAEAVLIRRGLPAWIDLACSGGEEPRQINSSKVIEMKPETDAILALARAQQLRHRRDSDETKQQAGAAKKVHTTDYW